jgi:hypothetical protein
MNINWWRNERPNMMSWRAIPTYAKYSKGIQKEEIKLEEYIAHPYDPIGPDGKVVRPLSYRNVLTGGAPGGYAKREDGGKKIDHLIKIETKVSLDDYPLYTS